MRFANAYALLLLLAVPLWWWFSRRRQRAEGIAYPAIGAAAVVAPSFATRLHQALPLVRALVMILCILAMARPQWGVEATRIYREGIAIAMVASTPHWGRAIAKMQRIMTKARTSGRALCSRVANDGATTAAAPIAG